MQFIDRNSDFVAGKPVSWRRDGRPSRYQGLASGFWWRKSSSRSVTFSRPEIARVGAVLGRDVFLEPDQVVELARLDAVGPEVGSPEDDGRQHGPLGRIEVQERVALHLGLDHPAHGEGPFIGDRFRVQRPWRNRRRSGSKGKPPAGSGTAGGAAGA